MLELLGELTTLLDDLQGFIGKVIKLNDKYTGYVKNCFMDNALLAKVCISSILFNFLASEVVSCYFLFFSFLYTDILWTCFQGTQTSF